MGPRAQPISHQLLFSTRILLPPSSTMAAATTNTTKLLVSILLSLLVSASIAESESQSRRREEARQCRINRLSATRPSRRIDSQGGMTELWDDNDDEFQCAGVAAMRNTIRPNSLSLPNYQSAPALFYVERGRGLVGISYPGCAETYQSEEAWGGRKGGQREEGTPERRDQHQKVHQVSQGDLILVPAGTTHYCINDGSEDLVVVSITDLENDANQLDNSRFRAFFLAGGIPRGSQHQTTEEERSQRRRERFQNVLRGLDEELLAEAFNIPVEVARKMQREDNRGFIVKLRDGWSLARPSQRYEERDSSVSAGTTANHQNPSSLEGSICSAKIFQNLDNPRDALFYGKNAGRLNAANRQTLPILGIARLSAEKLRLLPDALLSPHYTMYGHTVVYVTRGEARVQVVAGTDGRALLDQTVRQGEMFVIPQFAVATAKAGRSGFESVSFKTTGESAASPLTGSASVMRGLPLPVIANAYGISGQEAEDLKQNRRRETLLLSPTQRRPSP